MEYKFKKEDKVKVIGLVNEHIEDVRGRLNEIGTVRDTFGEVKPYYLVQFEDGAQFAIYEENLELVIEESIKPTEQIQIHKFKAGDRVRLISVENEGMFIDKKDIGIQGVIRDEFAKSDNRGLYTGVSFDDKGCQLYIYLKNLELVDDESEKSTELTLQTFSTTEMLTMLFDDPTIKFNSTLTGKNVLLEENIVCWENEYEYEENYPLYISPSVLADKWTLVQTTVPFTEAFMKYIKGSTIQSVVTNKLYCYSKLYMQDVSEEEVNNEWIIIKK